VDNKRLILSKNYQFFFNREKLEVFFFIYIIGNILFYFATGIGKAGSAWQRNPSSVLFNIFNIDLLIYIYYLGFREKINRNFLLIVSLYFIFQLIKGWTGFILNIFVIELFYRSHKKRFFKYVLLIPFVFFLGSLFYQFIYPLKYFIRLGYFKPISYLEASIKLFERLSFFSHSLVGIQNIEKIKELYNGYNYHHTEIIGFFKPSIPSFIFKNKDFYGFGTLLMKSVYPAVENTSANMGFFAYFYNLINIDFIDLLLYFCFFLILTFLYKFVLDFSDFYEPGKPYYVSFLIFLYFKNFFAISSLEHLSYGWFSIIWTYAFFILVKVISIKKIRINK
jgi:hypothetical protein